MKLKQEDIVHQLLKSETVMFICGNGLTMTKDIVETLVHLIANVEGRIVDKYFFFFKLYWFITFKILIYLGITEEEANEVVTALEKKGQIIKELWS